MSLIREALRKSVDENETPPPLPPNMAGGGKKKSSVEIKKVGLVIVLLLCLSGVLVYQFFPNILFPQKGQPPAPLKGSGETKALTPPGKTLVKEPAPTPQTAPLPPPSPAGLQDQSPVRERAPGPALLSRTGSKEEAARSSKSPLQKKPPESGSELRTRGPQRFASTRFFRPRPAVRSPKSSSLKEKPPAKVPQPVGTPEAQKPPTGPEAKDSLEVVRLFNQAVKEQQKGLFPQAIQNYQEVLQVRPNHWETYNNLGLIYQEQKRSSRALEMFQKALSLNPQYLKGLNNLGLLYLNLGKWEEAATQFRKSLELDANFIPAYINLSTVYKRQGRADLARKILYQALDHDAENIEAQYNLGLLWENEGVESKAVEHYQKFVSRAQGPYCDLANDLKKRWPGLK